MIGTTMAQPSTQAILHYSYQYRSLTMASASGDDPRLPEPALGTVRGGRIPGRPSPVELLPASSFPADGDEASLDRVELGNRRGLLPGTETILTILEEKVNARVEASFPAGNAESDKHFDYWSAEATGERIARFALKFYDRYAEKHGESEETLEAFLKYVTGAIDEGFGQARKEIANVSGGQEPENAKSLVDATYEKVISVLEEFRRSVLDRLKGAQPAVASEDGTGPGHSATGVEVA